MRPQQESLNSLEVVIPNGIILKCRIELHHAIGISAERLIVPLEVS
jgi:hypothetical protein